MFQRPSVLDNNLYITSALGPFWSPNTHYKIKTQFVKPDPTHHSEIVMALLVVPLKLWLAYQFFLMKMVLYITKLAVYTSFQMSCDSEIKYISIV